MLDPEMPTQELLLHMGELIPDEMLVARAAIRWANSQSSDAGNTLTEILPDYKALKEEVAHWRRLAQKQASNMEHMKAEITYVKQKNHSLYLENIAYKQCSTYEELQQIRINQCTKKGKDE